jgi:glycosyltransferase involved in cell wall biosynthesis
MKYSVVIPVFNSEAIVGETIDRTCAFFEGQGLDYELLLVNDASRDGSWDVIRQKAESNPRVIAIDLLRNSGQHSANYCGFERSTGDYVVTMDDDLQNPPEEIRHLIDKAAEGHDLVMGQFRQKRHSPYRRWGSLAISTINRRIFFQPRDLVVSNFRLIRRDVVDRILTFKTNYPYITGLVLMFASQPANTLVEHHDRSVGQSNYNLVRIAQLVMRILFNYSSYPLRLVATVGVAVAVLSFLLGCFYLGKSLLGDASVPGWTTLVVMLAFFNGVTLLILGMLGEYLIRLINQTSTGTSYHIRAVVRSDGAGE